MEYCLSLGSNLGDRLWNLRRAAAMIAALPGVRIIARSCVYLTDPVGVSACHTSRQFLNAVILFEAAQRPRALLERLQGIETALGRCRGPEPNAPRPIDIDIVYAGRMTIADCDLTIPHPRWAQRRFVVQPLARLRPDLVLPGSILPVSAILDGLPVIPRVTLYAAEW